MLQGPSVGIRPPTINIEPISSGVVVPLLLDIVGVFRTSVGMRTVARLLKKHALYQMKSIVDIIKVCKIVNNFYKQTKCYYVLETQIFC